MILTADIGNTHSVIGLWKDDELINTCRLSSSRDRTADEWRHLMLSSLFGGEGSNHGVNRAIYSSVVPQVNSYLEEALDSFRIAKITRLDIGLKLPFGFDYDGNEDTIGADRIANAAGGILNYGDNLIIVDFGTAITFCLITNRVYRGGVIAPGMQSAVNALFQKTAKLPQVRIRSTRYPLGKSTTSSIESGVYYGWKGLVREIMEEIMSEEEARKLRAEGKGITRIATGGIAEDLDFANEFFDVIDRNLTLRGLMGLAKTNP